MGQGLRQTRLADGQPADKSQQGQCKHDRHEHARNAVRHALNGRPRGLGLFHHANDLRQGAVRAEAARLNHQAAMYVEGGADNLVARRFVDRQAFAGEQGLIHRRCAFAHQAVDRDATAGPHQHLVTHLQRADRYHMFFAVVQHDRLLRRQLHQSTDRLAAAAAGPRLQQLAQRNERQNRRRGLKILAGFRQQPAQGSHAVDIGRPAAQGHQSVHVGAAVAQGPPRAGGILSTQRDDHHRRQQPED